MNRKRFIGLVASGGAVVCGAPWRLLGAGGSEAAPAAGSIARRPLEPRSGPRGATLFRLLAPEATGLRAESSYDDPRIWSERYSDFDVGSIGTGVAVGDYDGDGRPDIFVVSKTGSCRLYRNLGGWKFEDVTERAGVGDAGDAAQVWKMGAAFADVNNDGLLDLYVCRYGAPNLLYINQGDGTFKEEAAARGLAVTDGSVMAAFCDYDRDGWLDVFVQTNAPESAGHPRAQQNYLFHNNGDGTFTDVTAKAGITGKGQGHAAIWWDYDGDGWPDLYVGYDFTPRDRLFHNNRDGTFTERISSVVPHTPFSSMGADLGDVNNDGLIDLFVSDMAATSHVKDQRTMATARRLVADPDDASTDAPQYMRNALYLNTGAGRCLEAANLAGLAATDWTWSVRLEDFDNDGRLDLFVTNGMYREVNNADLRDRMMMAESPEAKVAIERAGPEMPERHLAFRNLGDLRFTEVGAAWGLDQRGIGFGTAIGDFDGDGNLDIIYASYRGRLTVLRNEEDAGQRVLIELRGTRSNRFGIGATVTVETGSGIQVRQLVLARGYLSSSEPIVHFGLGNEARIKRLTVEWPSGQVQTFSDLEAGMRYTLTEPSGPPVARTAEAPATLFRDVSAAANFSLRSREEYLDETAGELLLPMRQNRRGPALAVGDLNGDGWDDVVVGGTSRDPLRLCLGSISGRFAPADAAALAGTGQVNDGPILFFDAFGQGRTDLLVTASGSAMPAGSPAFQPRLFAADGRGGFQAAPAGILPELPISAGAAAAADFDRDGRLDLFIGGRVLPGQYPLPPRSALLANRGGRFEDVTDAIAPGLREVGMVTGALWCDVDGDGWPDLLLTLEWGPVKYFHNNQGRGFEDWSDRGGFSAAGTGWWTSIASADFNGDGRPDFVVGNVGLNTQYQASPQFPAVIYLGDFRGDGSQQLVEAYFEGGRLYPWRSRRDLGAAIPSVLRKYPRNDTYAVATLGDILGEERLAAARRFAATQFQSGLFLSRIDGTYAFEPLPRIAQVAPIQGLAAGDFDGDGKADIYALQNSFSPIPAVGRFDGGLSQFLKGDGRGGFEAVPPGASGLVVAGDAKALAVVDLDQDGWPDFLVSRNNGRTSAFKNGAASGRSLAVRLRGPKGNPTGIGARVTLEHADGASQAVQVHCGSGHFSQSTAACFFGWPDRNPPRQVRVRWPDGEESLHPCEARQGTVSVAAPGRRS
jgi:hypothetical protein